jgi:hypothetical protein
MDIIHETPTAAWQHICEFGGIELQGRDEGLDKQILSGIDLTARSLNEALAAATMEVFVRAFFRSLSPYIEMFRDILHFFEQADATQGKTQWTLRVGEVDLDLDHFRQWLDALQQLVTHEIEVPATDFRAEWQIPEVFRSKFSYDEAKEVKSRADVREEIREWLTDLESGNYPQMPDLLTPWNIYPSLSNVAAIIYVKLQILNDLNIENRDRLMEIYRQRQNETDRSDSFALGLILQNETDYWLRYVSSLLVLASSLPDDELETIGQSLKSITDEFPLRKFTIEATINELDSILSLPIWKQRYELYAVWIATEMIKALAGHDIEIHHDNGQIRFDFKETLVATIKSSPGPFKLIAERRILLADPVGHGRTHGVQPDHQLWTKVGELEVCRMAVEVKHYKKSSKSKFIDIFKDYARAIPDGIVYLVNHGPAGTANSNLLSDITDRCFSIGNLTPSNLPERRRFAEAVRQCVGEPRTLTNSSIVPTRAGIFMIDVSGSMSQSLQSDEMKSFIRDLIFADNPAALVAVDTKIIERFNADDTGYAKLAALQGGNTDLRSSVYKLLQEYSSILVITDPDGIQYLSEFEVMTLTKPATIPMEIEVLLCRNPKI